MRERVHVCVRVRVCVQLVCMCNDWLYVCKAWRARAQQSGRVSVLSWCVCVQGLVRMCSTTGVHVPNKADV